MKASQINDPIPEICKSVRDLRKRLGDSPEKFAHRIHSTMKTSIWYEHLQIPPDKILWQLALLAAKHNWRDLTERFQAAQRKDPGMNQMLQCDLNRLLETPRRIGKSKVIEQIERDDKLRTLRDQTKRDRQEFSRLKWARPPLDAARAYVRKAGLPKEPCHTLNRETDGTMD